MGNSSSTSRNTISPPGHPYGYASRGAQERGWYSDEHLSKSSSSRRKKLGWLKPLDVRNIRRVSLPKEEEEVSSPIERPDSPIPWENEHRAATPVNNVRIWDYEDDEEETPKAEMIPRPNTPTPWLMDGDGEKMPGRPLKPLPFQSQPSLQYYAPPQPIKTNSEEILSGYVYQSPTSDPAFASPQLNGLGYPADWRPAPVITAPPTMSGALPTPIFAAPTPTQLEALERHVRGSTWQVGERQNTEFGIPMINITPPSPVPAVSKVDSIPKVDPNYLYLPANKGKRPHSIPVRRGDNHAGQNIELQELPSSSGYDGHEWGDMWDVWVRGEEVDEGFVSPYSQTDWSRKPKPLWVEF